MSDAQHTYDYIIIGAGSAGCVLANRLSANPAASVLLIEAGGRDWYPWIHIPVGYFKTLHNPRYDWCYKTEPDPGLNGRSIDWPRGKVLGGSSAINGLLYVRGQPQDYDHWRQLGNAGWTWDEVLPYFMRAEDQERGADAYHGVGGPLSVSNMRVRREVCDAFIEAAAECGIPARDDFNRDDHEGVGYFQLTARKGFRCSTAVGYLKPVRRRSNLSVVTKAHVERIRFDSRRATSAVYRRSGTRIEARARREIILSAGAIGSPQILQISGVGPGELLQRLDIPVVHALPGVGANLQDHLQIRSVYKCRRPTLNDEVNNPLRKMLIGLEYILLRTGPMSMGASQVAAFAKTDPMLETPDIQFHFQPLSADKPGAGLHRFSAFTSSVCQLRPESRGYIEIRSPDAGAAPAIHPNYLSSLTDQNVTVAGMKLSRRICASRAMAPFVSEEVLPGSDVQSDEALLECARNIGQTIYHPVGTCKMGSDERAVVDERLRVHGVEGLRVVDASIMPTITSGNTNAPTIMIAEKAADMILDDTGGVSA
ncbi:MAG: choline dehydrogenase [Gammaproteobacteria bacterium]|nr:choline dehydrogenase [Gammaproteobacteria bacterium]NIP88385.1 choline dehydrogenase [Gammaproteobacteria bacterium]NIR22821.1 choline dehydrogenase [Gammaproteobacteria bacterium]NIS04711.1 choline dehydrogenase [Gammaproteobacteria bacterium]NIU40567.1 choline dehydrogenase [Gammaproteobacteria bacterium]